MTKEESKMTRGSMPSRQKIANYWTNTDEGQERIRQIKQEYNINVTNLYSIEHDLAHCWACNKTFRGGSKGYNTPNLGLQRCHIIPHSLGGSDHPSNLLLMCESCHTVSPDTSNERYFWKWFERVPDHRSLEIASLRDDLDVSDANIEALSMLDHDQMLAYLDKAAEDIGVTTHGGVWAQGTRFVLIQRALDLMKQDHPAKKDGKWALKNY